MIQTVPSGKKKTVEIRIPHMPVPQRNWPYRVFQTDLKKWTRHIQMVFQIDKDYLERCRLHEKAGYLGR